MSDSPSHVCVTRPNASPPWTGDEPSSVSPSPDPAHIDALCRRRRRCSVARRRHDPRPRCPLLLRHPALTLARASASASSAALARWPVARSAAAAPPSRVTLPPLNLSAEPIPQSRRGDTSALNKHHINNQRHPTPAANNLVHRRCRPPTTMPFPLVTPRAMRPSCIETSKACCPSPSKHASLLPATQSGSHASDRPNIADRSPRKTRNRRTRLETQTTCAPD